MTTTLAEKRPIPPPRPKCETVERMCKGCPFKDNGRLAPFLTFKPGELERIKAGVEAGAVFYCHETVILDPRTTLDSERNPTPAIQPHFRGCRGARRLHLRVWSLRVIASGNIPGEEP